MTDEIKLTTEYRARVYDDTHGFYVEVREDGDALGLCEIAYNEGDKEAKDTTITIGWPHALSVAEAIARIARLRLDAAK